MKKENIKLLALLLLTLAALFASVTDYDKFVRETDCMTGQPGCEYEEQYNYYEENIEE